MANVTVTIRTMDDGAVPAPIEGVLARIFDDGGSFIVEGTTGVGTGEANFTLFGDTPGVDYIVRLSKVGVSFPPDNEFTINVTDPPAPDNDFEFTGHVGLVGQLVKLVCQDDAVPTPNPVEGVKIRLYDSGDSFVTEMTTPASGEVELVLTGAASPGQKYIARLFPPSGSSVQNGPTQLFYVLDPVAPPDTNVFDFVVVEEDVPVTGDPLLCRLTGYFINAGGQPLSGVELAIRPREGYPSGLVVSGFDFSGEPTIQGGKIVAGEFRVTADARGYFDFTLPRRGVFDVHAPGLEEPFTQPLAPIWVPDAAGAKLEDVFFPYVTTVTYSETSIALAVEESLEVEVTLESTNLQENLTGISALNSLLVFQSSDEEVAVVEVTSEGTLLVQAVGPGTADIEVSRATGTVAPRRPEVPDLIPLPSAPQITVT